MPVYVFKNPLITKIYNSSVRIFRKRQHVNYILEISNRAQGVTIQQKRLSESRQKSLLALPEIVGKFSIFRLGIPGTVFADKKGNQKHKSNGIFMKPRSLTTLKTQTLLISMLTFLMMGACSESKQSGDGETAAATPSKTDSNSNNQEEGDNSENTLDETAFSTFKQKAIESCRSSITIYVDEILHTGFDGTKGFETPILGFMDCELSEDFYKTEITDAQYDEISEALYEVTSFTDEQAQLSFETPDIFQIKEGSVKIEEGVYRAVLVPIAAGESNITLAQGDNSASGKIIAKQYQEVDVIAGQNIYNGTTVINGVTACSGCHQAAGGVDHSANLVGVCSDTELISAVTTSVYGNNDEGEVGICTDYALNTPHNWTLDATQAAQVVAYLRSLPLEKEKPAEDPAANQ